MGDPLSCSSGTSQEMTLFPPLFGGGGDKNIWIKKTKHHLCYLKAALEEIPPDIAAGGLQTAVMPNAMDSVKFAWKTFSDKCKCLWEWCRLTPVSWFPLTQPCHSAWAWWDVGHVAAGHDTTVPLFRFSISLCNFCFDSFKDRQDFQAVPST